MSNRVNFYTSNVVLKHIQSVIQITLIWGGSGVSSSFVYIVQILLGGTSVVMIMLQFLLIGIFLMELFILVAILISRQKKNQQTNQQKLPDTDISR